MRNFSYEVNFFRPPPKIVQDGPKEGGFWDHAFNINFTKKVR